MEGKLKFKTWQEFLFVFPFLNGYVSKSSVGHRHPFPNYANCSSSWSQISLHGKKQKRERLRKLGVDSKGSRYWQVLSSLVISSLPYWGCLLQSSGQQLDPEHILFEGSRFLNSILLYDLPPAVEGGAKDETVSPWELISLSPGRIW